MRRPGRVRTWPLVAVVALVLGIELLGLSAVAAQEDTGTGQDLAQNGRLLFEAVDSTCILTCRGGGTLPSPRELWTVAPDGSEAVNVTRHPAADMGAQWSPDGSKIVFSSDRGGDFDLFAIAPDGAELTQLTTGPGDDEYPTWSPNGRRIAFVRGNVRRSYDIFVMLADGTRQRRIAAVSNSGVFALDWSPDGRRIAFTRRRSSDVVNGGGGGNDDIYTIRPDGSRLRPVVRTPRDEVYATWSPNGRWLAFTRSICQSPGTDEEFCNADIYKVGMGRLNRVRRLTTSEEFNITPSWSPDGTKIVYSSSAEDTFGFADLFVMDPDGSNQAALLRKSDSFDFAPDWQPVFP